MDQRITFCFIFFTFLVKQVFLVQPQHCGVRPKDHGRGHAHGRIKRIIGGQKSKIHSWPWLVNFIDKDDTKQYCSGSIIDRYWILSAAHCFVFAGQSGERISYNFSKYAYHVGDHTFNVTDHEEYTVEVSQLHLHPQYKLASRNQPGEKDIALLKLKWPLNFTDHVRPVCLPDKNTNFSEGYGCYLTGWGNIVNKEGYHRSIVLKETKLDLVSLDECNSNRSFNGSIPDSFLCAGFRHGGTDGCYGDSGAPLQCALNERWTIVGIMSWGKGCARPNFYGVYSNVKHLLPFVKQVLKGPNIDLADYHRGPIKRGRCWIKMDLFQLFTDEGQFTDVDLVRNLQLLPHEIQLSKNTTLGDLCFVINAVNSAPNFSTVANVLRTFGTLAERLEIYKQWKIVTQRLKISFMDLAKLFKLSTKELLNPQRNITAILNKVREIYT